MTWRNDHDESGKPCFGPGEGKRPTKGVLSMDWWRHKEVLAHLRVDPRTLKKMMRATPPHIEPPWVNVGGADRPRYMWARAEVDSWYREVSKWRTLNYAQENTEFDGETRMGGADVERQLTKRQRRRSGELSKAQSRGVKGGSLVKLANELIWRKP